MVESTKALSESLPDGITLSTKIENDMPLVNADAVQIHQMITALVSNSKKAITDSGEIIVVLRNTCISQRVCTVCRKTVNGDYVKLSVTDIGTGILRDKLENFVHSIQAKA